VSYSIYYTRLADIKNNYFYCPYYASDFYIRDSGGFDQNLGGGGDYAMGEGPSLVQQNKQNTQQKLISSFCRSLPKREYLLYDLLYYLLLLYFTTLILFTDPHQHHH